MSEPNIKLVSFNNATPSDDDNWWTGFRFNRAARKQNLPPSINGLMPVISKPINYHWSQEEILPQLILSGIFGKRIPGEKLGFSNPNDVLNKEIIFGNGFAKGNIVGVIKDYHSTSLKNEIAPVFMVNMKKSYNTAQSK